MRTIKFNYFYLLSLFSLTFTAPHGQAQNFECAKWTQAERQIEIPKNCDDTNGYGLVTPEILKRKELKKLFDKKTDEEVTKDTKLKDLALEAKFRTTSNMNATTFTFSNGVTRVVFRGSYLAPMFSDNSILEKRLFEKDLKRSCMKALVKKFDLSKILNYDELDWDSAKRMTKDEKNMFSQLNPNGNYWEFLTTQNESFQYKFKNSKGSTLEEQKKSLINQVKIIINEIAGDPKVPGAAYIHCYGGHHRTGLVWGVMQKCLGKMPIEDVLSEYTCHVGKGAHKDNEIMIREFPCAELI
jgi:hypothetical protein